MAGQLIRIFPCQSGCAIRSPGLQADFLPCFVACETNVRGYALDDLCNYEYSYVTVRLA